MIYRNDNIEIKDDYVKGKVKDLKEYFRYQIAEQCMTGSECDYEEFRDNVEEIIQILNTMYNIFEDNDNVIVSRTPMGDLSIKYIEEEK